MFSNVLFIVEILVAQFLLTKRLKRNPHYFTKLILSVSALCIISAFVPRIDNVWITCLTYLLLFALTIVALWLTYDEPLINVVFCAIASYIIQHFAYQFTNMLFTLIVWGESPLLGMYHTTTIDFSKFGAQAIFWGAVYVMGYFTIYGASWLLFARNINKHDDLKIKNQAFIIIIGVCIILNVLLNAVFVFLNESIPVLILIIWHVASAFNCFLLLQWQFELVNAKKLQTELMFTQQLLFQAQEQYKLSRENIDLINLKCHDMKHQIREIGAQKQLDENTVRDLEQTISVYDSMLKTGNEALDVILTEKSLKCLRHNVILNCIADGSAIGFMKSADVYSLFGNALDNAIEAVMQLDDVSQRVIGLKVYSVGELITISVKNFFKGEVSLDEQGMPRTTKGNKDFHGFGVKSIRMIVEKYEGDLVIVAEDNVFNLNILIPVAQTDGKM